LASAAGALAARTSPPVPVIVAANLLVRYFYADGISSTSESHAIHFFHRKHGIILVDKSDKRKHILSIGTNANTGNSAAFLKEVLDFLGLHSLWQATYPQIHHGAALERVHN